MAFLLNDYTDIRELAAGGMGKVYIALQKSLNRLVVIKEMSGGLVADQAAIMRFENEATAAASLSHDNIIRVYDFGEDRGSFYIAMEYVDGPDLEQLLKRPDFSKEIGLMICLYAFRGLNFAHQHNIIHRDVKPANFLVAKTGGVKVVDFGLAFAAARPLHLTTADAIVGTPVFMSPEQANGEEKKDIRMDVWAAGVLLYRLLTGSFPFAGNNLAVLINNIVNTKEQDIRELSPALPGDLANLIGQCLEKDRDHRLQNLAPLIAALQNYFYEIGVRDTVAEIASWVGGNREETGRFLRLVASYHLRKADDSTAQGDAVQSKAHLTEAANCDPRYEGVLKNRSVSGKKDAGAALPHARTKKFTQEKSARPRITTAVKTLVAVGAGIVLVIASVGIILFFQQRSLQPEVSPEAADTATAASGVPVPLPVVSDTPPASLYEEAPAAPPEKAVKKKAAKTQRIPAYSRPTAKRPVASQPAVPAANAVPFLAPPPPQQAAQDQDFGIVKVAADPAHARVDFDNEKMSLQDMRDGRRVRTGTHMIYAAAEGYEPFQKSIVVAPGSVQIVTLMLKPIARGAGLLHIHSYPWAQIFIDGEFKGNSPTAKPVSLSQGKHAVVLKREGFKSYEEMIEIKSGELSRIKARLEQ